MSAGSTAVLTIQVLVDAAKAKAGIADTKNVVGGFKDNIGKLAKPAALVFGGIVAGAISAGKAAAEDAQSQALLAQSMTKAAGASKTQIAATEDWIAAQAKATGVADDQLRPALGSLVRATGDVATSQDALKQAMDISAATGKPLQSVADGLAKGYAGNTGALAKLVPGLDKATVAGGDMKKIMAELARTTGGSAAAAADTAAGKMAIATDQMAEAKESIGSGLLPVMATLATMLAVVGGWMQENAHTVQILIVVLGALAGAVLAINAALKIYEAVQAIVTAATWLWNLALDANPVMIIVIAIIALIAVLVILYKRSSTVRAILNSMWSGVAAAASAAWHAITAAASATWKAITGAATAVRNAVVGVWNAIKSAGATVWAGITTAARRGLQPILDLIHSISSAFNAVIGAIKDVISWLGRIKVPKIPGLSKLLGSPSAASASAAAAPSLMGARGLSAPAVAAAGGGGVTFNLYGVLGAEDAARRIRAILRDDDRRRQGVRVGGRR